MKRWLTIGIAALLLVALVVLWHQYADRSTGSAEVDAVPTEVPVEEEEEVAVREHRKRGRTEPVAAPIAERLKPEQASETETADDQPARTEVVHAIGPPMQSGPLLSLLKSAYARESADKTSAEAERELRALFGTKDLPDEYLYSVSCHRTVCRFKMLWSKRYPVIHVALAMLISQYRPTPLAFDPLSEPDENGDVPFEAYVTREGYTLDDLK